ncbi:hypothetical protein RRG08_054733 [Elysia crispata]|uniref:Uncharacterized protein n=1 Tax=Elysia crispata TaxID=231223 RepID=A0AAE1E840_9GAST|nr:hypothetical protein RRG08_054733 [Elysia crispata]
MSVTSERKITVQNDTLVQGLSKVLATGPAALDKKPRRPHETSYESCSQREHIMKANTRFPEAALTFGSDDPFIQRSARVVGADHAHDLSLLFPSRDSSALAMEGHGDVRLGFSCRISLTRAQLLCGDTHQVYVIQRDL